MKYEQQYKQKQEKMSHSTVQTSSQSSNLSHFLKQCWRLIRQLIEVNQEPKIWQQRNRYGEAFYRAYDPRSGRSTYCANEDEVRMWLEQLHYRNTGER